MAGLRQGRLVATAVATAALVVGLVGPGVTTTAGAATRTQTTTTTSAGGKAPSWKVGDCYRVADPGQLGVDISTKVACTKRHKAQIIGGAALPAAFRKDARGQLFAITGAERAQLIEFADKTCAPSEVVGNVYPKKTANALADLFERYQVTSWIAPAAGRFAWAVPEADSFAAGAKDILCVYEPDPALSGTTAGDVRDIGTSAVLDTLRICFRTASGTAQVGTQVVTCDKVHSSEGLIWLDRDVSDLPEDVAQWTDATWSEFDDMCAEFGRAIVGTTRNDLTIKAEVNGQIPAVDGHRFVYCTAAPTATGKAFPAGFTVTGIGRKPIEFVKG